MIRHTGWQRLSPDTTGYFGEAGITAKKTMPRPAQVVTIDPGLGQGRRLAAAKPCAGRPYQANTVWKSQPLPLRPRHPSPSAYRSRSGGNSLTNPTFPAPIGRNDIFGHVRRPF
jgi:hypothetical protein